MRYEFQLAISTALCLILLCAGLLSTHLLIKPSSLNWDYYDPEFIFALDAKGDTFFEDICKQEQSTVFASSLTREAFSQASVKYALWQKHQVAISPHLRLSIVERQGTIDLRFFQPIINRLSTCPKTVIIQIDSFLPSRMGRDIQSKTYLRTPILFVKRKIDNLWPSALRRTTLYNQLANCTTKSCLNSARSRTTLRFQGFKQIQTAHRLILDDLINKGATIIILDIARSKSLEAEFPDELHLLRQSITQLAQQNKQIQYLAFKALDDHYYTDFLHLNKQGAAIFQQWFANTALISPKKPL